jgi:hypothetical protein
LGRDIKEVQNEYAQVCSQLGDAEYKISVISEDCRKLKRKLRQLNIEASQIQNEQHNKGVTDGQQADDASSTENA